MQRSPARSHESRADEKRPEGEVGEKHPADCGTQMAHRSLDERGTGCQLPASESLVEGELEHTPDDNGPKHGKAQLTS